MRSFSVIIRFVKTNVINNRGAIMMNKTILMLSVSCMSFIAGADLCYASFNPYDTPPALSAAMLNSRNSTHTSHLTAAHLSHLTAAHLSSLEDFDKDDNNKLVQLATACFVTDTTDCSGNEFVGNNADEDNGGVPPGGDDYELDDSKRCIEEGYTMTDCPEDSDPINFCPYDSTYFEKCKANCPSNYVTCEPPYYGVGEACGGKYASCECTPCSSGYDYTTIPEGYVQDGEACLDCDGKTKYKIKPNPCDGFMDCGSMGPEAGANTCQSGTEIKYDNCKPCPNECSMDSCPSPYTCKKEECSNKYCKNGCQSGYVHAVAHQVMSGKTDNASVGHLINTPATASMKLAVLERFARENITNALAKNLMNGRVINVVVPAVINTNVQAAE